MARICPKRGSLHMAPILGLLVVLAASVHKVRPDDVDMYPRNDCNIDALLQTLLMPDQTTPTLQVQALRQDLLRLMNNKDQTDYDLFDQDILPPADSQYDPDKRSLSSLARAGLVPKRSIASIMRSGLYRPIESDGKRSIATLAKNGQLPTLQSPEEEVEEEKRNLASLARSGLLQTYKRNVEAMARNGYMQGKRNLASLARSGYLNAADKRYIGALAKSNGYPFYKRNVASIARDGYYGLRSPYSDGENGKRNLQSLMRYGSPGRSSGFDGKRNIGALARDWSLPNHSGAGAMDQDSDAASQTYDDKRSLASLKARSKRSIFSQNTDEYPLPVMQNANGYDYEALLAELAEQYEPEQKRTDIDDSEGGEIDSVDSDISPAPVPPHEEQGYGGVGGVEEGSLTHDRITTLDDNELGTRDHAGCTIDDYLQNFMDRYRPAPNLTDKRYLIIPALDNILLRKNYPKIARQTTN